MVHGELHRLLAKVHRLQHKCSSTELARFGITPGQPRILNYLSAHNGCIQREFSENCDLEPATVTNILVIMEKSGLVQRTSDPGNRRVQHVFLTEKGSQTQQQVQAVFSSLEDDCFAGFTPAEMELSVQFLNRIYDNLKKISRAKTDG